MTKIFKIEAHDLDQEILMMDAENIPDGIYKIQNNKVSIPINNYRNEPQLINTAIKYEPILTITSKDVRSQEKDNNVLERLQEILKLSKLNHLEKVQKEIILKLIAKYQEVYSLDSEPLPYTNLTEHEIILKSGKIINLRSHKLPEKHRGFSLQETDQLLRKNIIRESQSPYNPPLWIVRKRKLFNV